MTNRSDEKLEGSFQNQTERRRQVRSLYYALALTLTGCRRNELESLKSMTALLQVHLGHSSMEMTLAYVREASRAERQAFLRRIFAWTSTQPPLHLDHSSKDVSRHYAASGYCSLVRQAHEGPTGLLRQRDDLDRVGALEAHLSALDEQCRPSD